MVSELSFLARKFIGSQFNLDKEKNCLLRYPFIKVIMQSSGCHSKTIQNQLQRKTYLFIKLLREGFKADHAGFFHRLFSLAGPEHHCDAKNRHSLPTDAPLLSCLLVVVLHGLLVELLDRFEHNVFDLEQPLFNGVVAKAGVNQFGEGYFFTLL